MADEKITGPVKRAFERNPLDEPAKTALQITGSVTKTDHPIGRADYRVDAD